jgi:hypothetical protein
MFTSQPEWLTLIDYNEHERLQGAGQYVCVQQAKEVWQLKGASVQLVGAHFNYLCTCDLYGPMRNVFNAGRYIM